LATAWIVGPAMAGFLYAHLWFEQLIPLPESAYFFHDYIFHSYQTPEVGGDAAWKRY
jgi:hypothetical protein